MKQFCVFDCPLFPFIKFTVRHNRLTLPNKLSNRNAIIVQLWKHQQDHMEEGGKEEREAITHHNTIMMWWNTHRNGLHFFLVCWKKWKRSYFFFSGFLRTDFYSVKISPCCIMHRGNSSVDRKIHVFSPAAFHGRICRHHDKNTDPGTWDPVSP